MSADYIHIPTVRGGAGGRVHIVKEIRFTTLYAITWCGRVGTAETSAAMQGNPRSNDAVRDLQRTGGAGTAMCRTCLRNWIPVEDGTTRYQAP